MQRILFPEIFTACLQFIHHKQIPAADLISKSEISLNHLNIGG